MLIKISRRLFSASKLNTEINEFFKDFDKVKNQYTPKPKIAAPPSEWNENLKEDWDEYLESWHEENPFKPKPLRYEIDGQDPHYEYPVPKERDFPPIPDAPSLKHKILLPQLFYLQNPETIAIELIGKVIEHQSNAGTISGIITCTQVSKTYQPEVEKLGILGMTRNKKILYIFAEDDEGEEFCIYVSSVKLIDDNFGENESVTGALKIKSYHYKKTSILYDANSPIRIYDEGYKPAEVKNEYYAATFIYKFYCDEFFKK
ncbi:unnamed protein product [Blepharisma stoltei]|uniref:Uncharacterized protein n=1 Tax=Blepharisma stoltei TaxID=1481888 RepID=A0AAU9KEJ2_9CILI|nr:unnamed protein product [Blepharisma stoltei]